VAALHARDAVGYAAAADDLVGAHRERRDEQRTAELLAALGSPALAQVWSAEAAGPARFGFVWFTRTAPLLDELPGPDRADVVVVLDAARLGLDRALLAAAAPRLVVTAASGARAGAATLLGLLHRASALVIRGRAPETTGRVVPITPAARPLPVAGHGGVEQAGA
jgi:hypothetical protein